LNKNSLHQVISRADDLYAGRADLSNVSRSVEVLQQAEVDSYEIAWRISRALFFLGQEKEDEARSFHGRGVEVGRRAIALEPKSVEGHFWLGVNLALLAQTEEPLGAMLHSLGAKRALRQAIAIDRAYHGAGPLRVLARLQHKLPRWLGGGVGKARENFEQAIRLAPANTVTRIFFADLLLEAGEVRRARNELEQILNGPFDPDWAFEIERDRALAKEMIRNLTLDSSEREQ
jgi:uncharacterized protein (TIGR02996 family)